MVMDVEITAMNSHWILKNASIQMKTVLETITMRSLPMNKNGLIGILMELEITAMIVLTNTVSR